jgi:hypothetical protein
MSQLRYLGLNVCDFVVAQVEVEEGGYRVDLLGHEDEVSAGEVESEGLASFGVSQFDC